MKKLPLLLIIASTCFYVGRATAQTASSQVKSTTQNSVAPIDGAWQSTDHKDFFILSGGFFSSVSQDSAGIWKDTHAGSYTVDNANTITLKIQYSSWPEHIGGLHTIEYERKGESLTIKWFKKLLDAKGDDVTSRVPKGTQTEYVRAQK